MKIGIDARFLQGPRRGQGQYVYYLIKELLRIDDDNEYVAFYNGLKDGALAFDEPTPRLRQVWCNIPGTILKKTWSGFRFPPIEYLTGPLSVFHNPTNYSLVHYGPIPSKAPSVVTFNGMAHPSKIWTDYDPGQVDGWFEVVAASAAIIIVVSEMVKRDIQKRVRIPDEKLRIIHYGVSEKFRRIDDRAAVTDALSRYGLTGKRYLLYVGAAEPNKNLEKLIDVFSGLSGTEDMRDLYLVMAGETDDNYRRLAEKVNALNVSRKVIFTGYVDHDDLPYLYNGATAFILPTLIEWFGIPVLEALACGVPLAVSKNTGALDVAGDSVVTFDPQSSDDMARRIYEVVLNQGLRDRIKSKAPEIAKGLSWGRMASKTLEAYDAAYRTVNR